MSARTDIDPVAVERAVAGDLRGARLNLGERMAAIRELHARGYLDGEIAQRVECTKETVYRTRRRLELPANYDPNRQQMRTGA